MTQILGPDVDTISVDFALVRDIVDKVNDLIDQDAKQRGRRLGRVDERQLAMARTMDVIVREGAARARQGLDMWSEVQENAIRDAVMDSMFRLGGAERTGIDVFDQRTLVRIGQRAVAGREVGGPIRVQLRSEIDQAQRLGDTPRHQFTKARSRRRLDDQSQQPESDVRVLEPLVGRQHGSVLIMEHSQ